MRFVVVMLICLGLLLVPPQLSLGQQEQAIVKKITYRPAVKGVESIEFQLNGAHIPKIFMLEGEKPRLVIDFLETTYSGATRLPAEGGTLVRGIRVGFHQKPKLKSRVVVDLAKDRKVVWTQEFIVHKNLLLISMSKGEKAIMTTTPIVLPLPRTKVKPASTKKPVEKKESSPQLVQTPAFASAPAEKTDNVKKISPDSAVADSRSVLLDVSFDNVYAKSGEMILFKFNNFHPPTVSATEKGVPRIICDFPDTRVSDEVQEILDASGHFVDKIRVEKNEFPDKVRVVIDLFTGNDYDLQQVFFKEDNLFVLIVNTLGPEMEKEKTQ